jgi:hypothetical protein
MAIFPPHIEAILEPREGKRERARLSNRIEENEALLLSKVLAKCKKKKREAKKKRIVRNEISMDQE